MLTTYLKFKKRNGKDARKEENNKLNYNCKECKKRSLKSIIELIKKFPNVYQFSKEDINKFVLLLRKGFSPYEYMDTWKRFNKTSLPDKKKLFTVNCI